MELEGAQENATPIEVRTAQRCAPTQEGFVRFKAITLFELDYEKYEIAEISDCSIRTLNRWVANYKAREARYPGRGMAR